MEGGGGGDDGGLAAQFLVERRRVLTGASATLDTDAGEAHGGAESLVEERGGGLVWEC